MSTNEVSHGAEREALIERLVKCFDHHDPGLSADVLDEVYKRLHEGDRLPTTDAHGGFRLVTRHDDLAAIEKNHGVFCSAKGVMHPSHNLPQIIPIEFDPPEHSALRKLFTDILNVQSVKEAEPALRSLTHELLQRFAEGSDPDFVSVVAVQLPMRAIGTLLGWDETTNTEVLGHATKILEHSGADAAIQAVHEIGRISQAQIDARRVSPQDDYLTTLANASIGGEPLTDARLQNALQSFMFAGFETTARAIGSMVLHLAQNPDLQAVLRSDASARSAAIEEALRLYPPSHTMFRTVTEPTCLQGVELEAGDKIALLYAAANRDPAKFEEPDSFQLERPNSRQHLSFGFGAHFCAGAPLARAEMRILLEELASYPTYELAGEPRHSPHLMMGQMMGVDYLPLRFKSRDDTR